ncbi:MULTISPECIES: Tat pathway signal sequence domain protein [unclassified Streptomyces]|uniref:Tat pathway signal sequence domain protein n=1 Tax=unclassified Streptomyces TaxID=2593676 RepID=UPI000CAF8312|nr:Tat pathway signal sequence domain protein [Streptomyces sp. CB01373]PJM92801.1 Tat pathway signal sequence domain protein [Streptomyces sp. CB01373]
MRRTILTVAAVACTAVLAGTAPAFADGDAPSPVPSRAATPSPVPTRAATPAPAAPAAEPTRAPARGQVRAVPAGAPDTGVTTPAQDSGSRDGLIGGGAGMALVVAGGAVLVVRKRRTTGA